MNKHALIPSVVTCAVAGKGTMLILMTSPNAQVENSPQFVQVHIHMRNWAFLKNAHYLIKKNSKPGLYKKNALGKM